MRVSMHNWMRAEPIEVTIARLAKCGYDAIEISGEPEKYDTKHVGKLLKDHGLKCWGSVTLMLGDRDLLAKDEKQRAMSVKYVKDTITMVKARRRGNHHRPVHRRQDRGGQSRGRMGGPGASSSAMSTARKRA